MTNADLRPGEGAIIAAIAQAVADGGKLAITGGGSKAGQGASVAAPVLPLAPLSGVVDYDPAELVLTVRPGTPLAEVQALVAAERQMLAFEPFDHGPIFGTGAGRATIGGVIAAGVAGSRRVSAGGARDHLLGFRAVSGRAEAFVGGAKVVKNVTGYDLPKLATGIWGRLFALTELTVKVLPRPETAVTIAVFGLDPGNAVRAMALAMGSQCDVAAAAHCPAVGGRAAITALRLEGFEPSVVARGHLLETLLAAFGEASALPDDLATAFWADLQTLRPLGPERPLWRINLPPGAAPALINGLDGDWVLDWAGGLVWVASNADPRALAQAGGGHATLVRGPEALRAMVPTFHPQSPGLAALETRVRRAFDPAGVFETGRF